MIRTRRPSSILPAAYTSLYLHRAAYLLFYIYFIASILFFTGCSTPTIAKLQDKYTQKYCDVPAGRLVCPATYLDTKEKVVALTLDACGGRGGNGYDRDLISFLKKKNIPAVLFINARWAKANPALFLSLSEDPLFEIGSHGYNHLPCTVQQAEKYGIQGTSSIPSLIEEVELSSRVLQQLGAKRPKYFRSGTAWYDECSLEIIEKMGYSVINFSINSRDYNKYNTPEIIARYTTEKLKPGSIIIMHMNHPRWNTYEGFLIAYKKIIKQGYTFVRLGDYRVYHRMRTKLPK